MKFLKTAWVVVFIFGWAEFSWTQQYKDTLKVLFVGNSYTFTSNMPHLLSLISDSTDVKLITSKSTASGATLKEHWTGIKGLSSRDVISNGRFDIVILQEHSMGTIHKREDFFYYSKKFCDLIKESGAKPYFFTTWAREKVPQYQKTITAAYILAAKENGGNAILVGQAWQLAKELRPSIELYTPDGSHPTDLGAYLTACVFAHTFCGNIPENMPSRYFINDELGEDVMILREKTLDIIFCHKVASEIVNN